MSAAFSKEGRSFAAKNVDSLITMFSNISSLKTNKKYQTRSKKYKNKIKVYGLYILYAEKQIKKLKHITKNMLTNMQTLKLQAILSQF